MTESRLKKSLNTGGRQDRSNGEASHSAPEDKFISTQERRRMWSEEWTQHITVNIQHTKYYIIFK